MFQVRIQCIQTLESIFSHTDGEVSTPYIHALAPRLLEYLHESHANVNSEEELQLITESISAMELLIPRTLPEHSKLFCFLFSSKYGKKYLNLYSICSSGH